MLVVTRFRVSAEEADRFRAGLEEARAALAAQRGYVGGAIGRNVDDPELWVLQTSWEGPGAYRRALSAYDVKLRAWELLGRAIDEPGAYETLEGTEQPNAAHPRSSEPGPPTRR